MRLTLRSLLAYLDDMLEPSQTKEIGEKITQGSFAANLVDRIRDVLRRRRLTAPDVSGPGAGVDANTVAEYLDNTLSPDKVADFEKVCLDSDIHLAEVAACHQVLTLVLGEPVDVPSQTRERMYALGPVSKGDALVVDKGTAPMASVVGSGERSVPRTVQTESTSVEEKIPDYLRTKPVWRRVIPYAALAIVLLIWLGLFFVDPTMHMEYLFSGKNQPQPLVASDEGESVATETTVTGGGDQSSSNEKEQTSELPGSNSKPAVVPAANLEPETRTPVPTTVTERVATEDETPSIPAKPEAEPKTIAKVERPAAGAEEPPIVKPPATVPNMPLPPIRLVSKNGICIHLDDRDSEWRVLPVDSLLHADERLVSPEPFEADLEVGDQAVDVAILGGTSLTVLGPGEAASFGFDLQQGRLVLRRKAVADEDDGAAPVRVAISASGRPWRVELLSPETACGIEIVLKQPDQFEQDLSEEPFLGQLCVVNGSVRFSDSNGFVRLVQANEKISLSLKDLALMADPENPVPNETFALAPEWTNTDATVSSPAYRQYARLFEREFEPENPVRFSLLTSVKTSQPKMSELAAKCLALIENHEALAQALKNPDREEARHAAIEGLRSWLPIREENRALLKGSLAKVYHESDAEAIYHLLWGYNEADARNRIISRMLVDWLKSDTIAIRELAFYHIRRLTNRTNDYRPNNPLSQREVAVRRWEEFIADSPLIKE